MSTVTPADDATAICAHIASVFSAPSAHPPSRSILVTELAAAASAACSCTASARGTHDTRPLHATNAARPPCTLRRRLHGAVRIARRPPHRLRGARRVLQRRRHVRRGARVVLLTTRPEGEFPERQVDVVAHVPAQTMADDEDADGLAVAQGRSQDWGRRGPREPGDGRRSRAPAFALGERERERRRVDCDQVEVKRERRRSRRACQRAEQGGNAFDGRWNAVKSGEVLQTQFLGSTPAPCSIVLSASVERPATSAAANRALGYIVYLRASPTTMGKFGPQTVRGHVRTCQRIVTGPPLKVVSSSHVPQSLPKLWGHLHVIGREEEKSQ